MQAAGITSQSLRAISYLPVKIEENPATIPPKPEKFKGTYPGQYPFQDSQLKSRPPSQKLDVILKLMDACGWPLGEFLHHLFRLQGARTRTQNAHVVPFMSGTAKIKALDIVRLWYDNRHGRPTSREAESKEYFSVSKRSSELQYARTALSTWALEIVGKRITREANRAVLDPGLRLRASEDNSTFKKKEDLVDVDVLVGEVDDVISHVARVFGGSQGEDHLDWTDENMDDTVNETTLCEEFDDFENEDLDIKPISCGEGVLLDSRDNNATMVQNFMDPGSSCDASFYPGATMNLIETKRPVVTSNTLVSWSAMADFSIPSLRSKYRMIAPTTWHLLEMLATEESQKDSSNKIAGCLPGEKLCTSVFSELMYCRDRDCNLLPLCRSISLFSGNTRNAVFHIGEHLGQCVPYSTAHIALQTLAVEKLVGPT